MDQFSVKKFLLKTLQNLQEKKSMLESLFNKDAGLRLLVYQKETPEKVFCFEFCDFFKNSYFVE